MMDPSETNSFEEQWKRVFQEASETPPLSAWEGIEARLDKEERKVVPLWWQTPRLWYAAASVAALLMVGIALWNGSDNAVNEAGSQVALNKSQGNAGEETKTQEKPEGVAEKALSPEKKPAVSEESGKIFPDSEAVIATTNKTGKSGNEKSVARNSQSKIVNSRKPEQNANSEIAAESNVAVVLKPTESGTALSGSETANSKIASAFKDEKDLSLYNPLDNNGLENDVASLDAASRIMAETLTPIGYKDLDVYVQKRYVFFRPNTITETPVKAPKKDKEYYAGISMMPASFNPNVKIIEAPSAFAFANASRQSLDGTSHSGTSYALQTQGGTRLSKHWSLESGISYLQGNSTYEGGGYLLDATTSRSQNVLQSALDKGNYVGNNGGQPASPPANSLYIELKKDVRNDYRFLQVPVQAGFTLNPDKKLSYSLLGGMMANFFMNNEIESPTGAVITTKASDDVYRSLNWAATTGLRFNYKLSSQWKATLTGTYQQSISSGFKNNETLESHPYLYGISWGVRYSF